MTQLWIRDAALPGMILKKGIHYIYAKFDGLAQAKLDDGDWVVLTADSEAELINADDTQRVLIYFSSFSFPSTEESISTVIVKQEDNRT